MNIFPAIDIHNGQCVRLYKGNYATAAKVAEDPLETALTFQREGAEFLHMVDLNGAKDAKRVNSDIFTGIAAQTQLKVQVGGGIRNIETCEYYLSRGISRVILGSVAVKNPALVVEAVRQYGERIVVGIDAKNGRVACEGWLDTSDVNYIDLAKKMESVGVRIIVFTDISKDGTMAGPNLEQLQAINEAVGCDIIASGGVSSLEDIRALKRLNLYGAICGKSLYSGAFRVSEAIEAARQGGELC